VHGRYLEPVKYIQTRLPKHLVQRIVMADAKDMRTATRFYVMNKMDEHGKPRVTLLDQSAIICALRIVCPTINIQCAYAISLNVLVRLGVNADINGDGFISAQEWAALDEVLRSQEAALEVTGNTANHKSRLMALML